MLRPKNLQVVGMPLFLTSEENERFLFSQALPQTKMCPSSVCKFAEAEPKGFFT